MPKQTNKSNIVVTAQLQPQINLTVLTLNKTNNTQWLQQQPKQEQQLLLDFEKGVMGKIYKS